MEITPRIALVSDAPALAALNRQLIEDEGSRTRLTEPQLTDRMRSWLQGRYTAVLFEGATGLLAYALWRADDDGVYLRQFFIQRHLRRHGLGGRCLDILFADFLAGERVVLDVLKTNPSGLAFWKSMGFNEYAVRLAKTA